MQSAALVCRGLRSPGLGWAPPHLPHSPRTLVLLLMPEGRGCVDPPRDPHHMLSRLRETLLQRGVLDWTAGQREAGGGSPGEPGELSLTMSFSVWMDELSTEMHLVGSRPGDEGAVPSLQVFCESRYSKIKSLLKQIEFTLVISLQT